MDFYSRLEAEYWLVAENWRILNICLKKVLNTEYFTWQIENREYPQSPEKLIGNGNIYLLRAEEYSPSTPDVFCRVKIFHRSSQIVFFATMKYPKVRRLAFDRVQELEWVLWNNCNCYLNLFLHFSTILAIRRYARFLEVVERGSE